MYRGIGHDLRYVALCQPDSLLRRATQTTWTTRRIRRPEPCTAPSLGKSWLIVSFDRDGVNNSSCGMRIVSRGNRDGRIVLEIVLWFLSP